MSFRGICGVLSLMWLSLPLTEATMKPKARPIPLLRPLQGRTTLEVMDEGLTMLRNLKGPVAPVVVIGPYRSGKSFTLNQLLNVSCEEGFGVGHTRQTETRGIWMWGEPIKLKSKSSIDEVNMLLFDTEGFESAGKADSYDDRIFAFSTLISSVLIYNLPEAIRESDLEKLSFATELARAFFPATETNFELPEGKDAFEGSNQGELPVTTKANVDSLSRAMMIWLIQRDFLRGESLQNSLEESLRTVPNPNRDPGIEQLNRIREGLGVVAVKSAAIGLPQPHIERARLCQIPDSELDSSYLRARDELRNTVFSAASNIPKSMQGQLLDGSSLADLIVQIMTALNGRDFPTANSLVEYFNKDLIIGCAELYRKQLEEQILPVDSTALSAVADAAKVSALEKFEREKFGSLTDELRDTLFTLLQREYENRITANTYQSTRICEKAEMECENQLEREANQNLPSMGRFQRVYDACSAKFSQTCIGPAYNHHYDRLSKAWEREFSRFSRDYNDKLLNGMIIGSILCICVFRFVIKWSLGETFGWIAFIFLQVWPRTFVGSGSTFFDSDGWQLAVRGWEMVVNNPFLDIQKYGIPSATLVGLMYLTRRRWWPKLSSKIVFRKRRKRVQTRDLDV